MSQVRLYLDVDGVINAQMPMGWGRLQNGNARFENFDFRIRWAPAMIDALREFDFEVVWTTTWRDDAPRSIAKLTDFGLAGRVLHPGGDRLAETTFPSIDWKWPAVQADQKRSPSPFVWIDDEITTEMQEWAIEAGGMALCPKSILGITPAHVNWIRDYVNITKFDHALEASRA